MKILRHCAVLVFLIAVCAALSFADDPGAHPAYLHALSDLRAARAHLDKLSPSDHVDNEETHAIREIDAAINEIKKASIDDGKNLNDHPPVDAGLDKTGRYHRALQLLDKAHHDISEKESDEFAHGLKHRALEHIDSAHGVVDHLIVQTAKN